MVVHVCDIDVAGGVHHHTDGIFERGGGALTVGVRRSGLLLSLIVLPLYIPILIFGTSAVPAAASGLPVSGQIYLLGAMLVLALTLTPFAAAGALRISMS